MLCLYLRDDVIYLAAQLVDFGDGGADVGVELRDVDDFAGVFGFNVAAHRQVVVVGADGFLRNVAGDVRHVGFCGEVLQDLSDVIVG